jgi:EAL domain-containing protein (putative c-di-GMP-specific phosphodiesterase class I)
MVSIRPSDFVGRLGREKFMVLLHGMRTPADIARICQRIHESVEQPCFIEGHKVFTTVTIGSAFSTSTFHTADQMVQAAETAMHRGKQHGGGGGVTEMFDPTMGQEVRERLKLEGSLRLALERNELMVYFQPIVSLASRKLAGFEALCRWKREDGFVSPGEFIPLAEETGLINNLGHWVLTHACESVAEWQRMTKQRPFVSINLSGKQLANGTIVEDVKSLIKRLKIPPAQIKLEVTETALITNTDLVARTLHDLRDLGVRLALDDFGTGYSSLNYLHRFPFHTIKIDKSFVDMLGKDKESAAIIPTIIQLARSLNMEVIAEGVETEEQARQLQHMGCPYGQGYLFARALPKHQLPELFKRNKISAN